MKIGLLYVATKYHDGGKGSGSRPQVREVHNALSAGGDSGVRSVRYVYQHMLLFRVHSSAIGVRGCGGTGAAVGHRARYFLFEFGVC